MSKKFEINDEDKKCAPSKKYEDNSCLTLDNLINIAISYNLLVANKNNKEPIQIYHDKKYLVKEVGKRLKGICKDQICWLKQDFVKALKSDDIEKNTFLPKISQGKFDWLSTTNINEVMEQREHIKPEFKFFGAVPLDFDNPRLRTIYNIPKDIEEIDYWFKKGKYKFGFIFNHDKSYQSGSHWVALFVNLRKNHVYYFDSFGDKPKKEVVALIKRLALWCYLRNNASNNSEIFDTMTYNKIRHQYKNSECGVYSINFILRMVNEESFENITENITTDDEINECRKIYFRFL